MPTSPPLISTLPTAPSTADIANFDVRADAHVAAVVAMVPQVNAATSNVYANALDAESSAQASANSAVDSSTFAAAASTSAAAAASASGAGVWVSGTSYTFGAAVWSPIDRLIYRRIVAGAGTTDPSADATNWALLGNALGMTVAVVSGTTQTASPTAHYVLTHAAATTLTLPASPISGTVVWVTVANSRLDNMIARNGQTIMGLAENITIDLGNTTVQLRFVNSSWRIL